MDINTKEKLASQIRKEIVKLCYLGKTGHISGSLSVLDILVELYFDGIMQYDTRNPEWEGRDRFILSKGHATLAFYNVLCDAGYFSRKELETYCQPGTIFGGHPSTSIPGVEAATGALGHGLSFAVGLALAAKRKHENHLVYVVTGDGECQEGSIWEAAMSISQFQLNNLIWIIDHNRLQATGWVSDLMEVDSLLEKGKAFGLDAKSIDGHDYNQLKEALSIDRNNLPNKPRMIVANTIKGKGFGMFENNPEWHSKVPSSEEFDRLIREMGITQEEFDNI